MAHQSQQLEHAILRTSHQPGLHYSLFAPLHYERNYAYPLVIWLHGPGKTSGSCSGSCRWSACGITCRSARADRVAVSRAGQAYTWSECESDITAAENSVFECLEVARTKFNVAAHRVFLAGYQAGGTMAFRLGMKCPGRFAGVVVARRAVSHRKFAAGAFQSRRANSPSLLPRDAIRSDIRSRQPVRNCDCSMRPACT